MTGGINPMTDVCRPVAPWWPLRPVWRRWSWFVHDLDDGYRVVARGRALTERGAWRLADRAAEKLAGGKPWPR